MQLSFVFALAMAATAGAQRAPSDQPGLAAGDRVRMWIVPGLRVTGILVSYSPDALAVEGRQGEGIPLLGRPLMFPPTQRYDLSWVDVRRIDVPDGRNVLGGVGGGLAGAVFMGALISLGCTAEGGHSECGVLHWTLRAAPFTVPLGAVFGFFSTRWRRVY